MAGNRNSGRKSKEKEQEIIERMSLLDDLFFDKLTDALQDGEPYAVKLFATHRIPKPNADVEVQNFVEQPLFNLPKITFVNSDEAQRKYLEERNNPTILNE